MNSRGRALQITTVVWGDYRKKHLPQTLRDVEEMLQEILVVHAYIKITRRWSGRSRKPKKKHKKFLSGCTLDERDSAGAESNRISVFLWCGGSEGRGGRHAHDPNRRGPKGRTKAEPGREIRKLVPTRERSALLLGPVLENGQWEVKDYEQADLSENENCRSISWDKIRRRSFLQLVEMTGGGRWTPRKSALTPFIRP